MTKLKCNIAGCLDDGLWQLGFEVWANKHKDHTPIVTYYGLAICSKHRDECRLEHLLTAEAKERFTAAVMGQGKAAPDFDTANLIFHPIIDGKLYVPGGIWMGNDA